MSSGKKKGLTPLMRQYFEIKDQYPETVLLFRVGDFYETFADDAVQVSRELGITLTRRNNGGDQTPLAGFPFHALETYLPKLVRLGYRVAICEQKENPEEAKKAGRKVVEREVTEITTPGVTLSEKLLDHNRNNYIVALHVKSSTVGVAFCDISTGEFALCQIDGGELQMLLQSLSPSEILIRKRDRDRDLPALSDLGTEAARKFTVMEEWLYEGDYGYRQLTEHFQTHSLKGFGVEQLVTAHVAGGVLLHYMQETQRSSLKHIRKIQAYEPSETMSLDRSTRRNLELISTLQESSEGTLISILDRTLTAMGGRLLRKWIMRPLKNRERIEERLSAVELFYRDHDRREQLRELLREMGDLERMISRISVGRTNARDLRQLQRSLGHIPPIKSGLKGLKGRVVEQIFSALDDLPELSERIDSAIVDDPPASLRDGGVIRDGFNADLDDLRDISRNGKSYLAEITSRLGKETGIPSLKIGYNKVFGYYIEVTHTHKEKVPEHFIRKQTLVNSERYITPELKEVEEKVLTAEDRIKSLELELFEELRRFTAGFSAEIQEISRALAELDCLQSFADVSYRNRYVKPQVDESDQLLIRKGRHPVVEQTLPPGEPFIPNDLLLNRHEQQILIITGPNMAGKSIILRQAGLIVLMAQVGCFVPAEEAQIGLVDKIFTRVGASDNLSAGESTFLVEMNEAANILNNATPRSLILFDEVGRGTSTFDGLSIAWSLVEYLHNQPSVAARTLFATHYHELNELESLYERIRNYNVEVREHDGKVIFMHKLRRGGADHSYGIQVADMAGLPEVVIRRAREILTSLEQHSLEVPLNESGDSDGPGESGSGSDSASNGRHSALNRETEREVSAGTANGTESETGSSGGGLAVGGKRSGGEGAGSGGPGSDGERPGSGGPGSGGTGSGNFKETEPLRRGARQLHSARNAVREVKRQPEIPQMSLFGSDHDPALQKLLDKLDATDPERMTPIDALMLLNELKRMAGERS